MPSRRSSLLSGLDRRGSFLALGVLALVLRSPSGRLTRSTKMISRLEREVRLHKRLRDLQLQFSRHVAGTPGLTPALEALTPEIRELLGVAGVEVWLHDRRARQLSLATSAGG